MSSRGARAQKQKKYSMSAAIAVRRTVKLNQVELAEFANYCGRRLGDNGQEIGLGSMALTLLEERNFKRCRTGKPLPLNRVREIAATLEDELCIAGFNGERSLQVQVDPRKPLDFYGQGKKLAIPVLCSEELSDSREVIQRVIKEETGRFIEYGSGEFDPHITIAHINNGYETQRTVEELAHHWREPSTIALNGIAIYRNWQG